MNKKDRKEELEYVLKMYKNIEVILDSWDKEDLKNRIKDVEQELKDLLLAVSAPKEESK